MMPVPDSIATSPAEAVELLDHAFSTGDIEAILRFYEDHAIVIAKPGSPARGKAEIAAAYRKIIKPGMATRQIQTNTLEADGIALFISRWELTVNGQDPQTFIATVVFRKQSDGGWKALIDNAYGPAILEQEGGRS